MTENAQALALQERLQAGKTYKKKSQAYEVWRRLRKNKGAMIGLGILAFFVLISIFADVIADYDTQVIHQDVANRLQAPSAEHWFGTDEYGRDIFARIVHGTRISLYVGLLSVVIGTVIGTVLGALAGYYGGVVDNTIMRILDIFLALPAILLCMAIIAAFGPTTLNLIFAIGVSNVPKFSRVVRGAVITIKDQEFVESARAAGVGEWGIILRHIIPNCMAPIIVQVTLRVAYAILATASLSFLGIGVMPPTPEWGAMLNGGRSFIRESSYLTIFPGLAIMLTVLSLNLLGDGLRDALDPRLK